MRVWIDATRYDGELRVFGMSLLERHLRALLETKRQLSALKAVQTHLRGLNEAWRYLNGFVGSHLRPNEIRIQLAPGAAIPELPRDLLDVLPIVWKCAGATEPVCTRDALAALLREADGEPVLAFEVDTVTDQRLVEHLIWSERPVCFISADGAAVARFDAPLPDGAPADAKLATLAATAIEAGQVDAYQSEDFEAYIPQLRRVLSAYCIRVRRDAELRETERFLFYSNYKGATDLLTKWVFPPLVWRAVHPLAERRIHPNLVTALGIFCCFAAIPFFAVGWWLPGLFLAYVMAVLDSVDGKLARLTFTSSKQGEVLDHGTDIVHPPLWYFAWAWGLSGGVAGSAVFQASIWMAGFYVLDRLLETLFKSCTGGRSVQDYTPLDTKLRTFVSRRNVNLALFTLALPFGLGVEAFYAVVALQALTALYHLVRVIQFWDDGERNTRQALQAA